MKKILSLLIPIVFLVGCSQSKPVQTNDVSNTTPPVPNQIKETQIPPKDTVPPTPTSKVTPPPSSTDKSKSADLDAKTDELAKDLDSIIDDLLK